MPRLTWTFLPKMVPFRKASRPLRIDQVPLDWSFGDGVVLDLHERPPGQEISAQDVPQALEKIGYALKPRDIVCVRTDADKRHRHPDFFECFPGMSREATLWSIDRGSKVAATDAAGWDIRYKYMKRNSDTGRPNSLWPSNFLVRERKHIRAENRGNLDQLPPTGFKIALFPIKIEKASGPCFRAVAFVPA